MDFIEWSWTPVEDVSGYDVQFSANEAFTDEDEIIARTAEEISYRRDGLEAGTSAYLRVRSATGADDDRVTSDWSTHVTGMTMEAPPPPMAPATPTGLEVSATTQNSITWTWNASEGAVGYVVQASADEMFELTDTVLFDGVPFTTETSYTATDLEPETTLYVRVAAGVGTPTDPVLSAWTTHVTGTTMAARLAAPANVRDTDRGSDFIEWEWDEVPGASGYQGEFSTDSGFSDSATFERPGMSNTTVRVSRLDPESDGYFRVRAYAGSVSDRMFGDWSEADMATTEEPPPPPPAEPLDAPGGLRSTGRDESSISLAWDEVDDAATYLVQEREAGDSGWDDSSCGGGDNEVTDTTCVASGLAEGTAYDFRVRALPDSGDTEFEESAWTQTTDAITTLGTSDPGTTGGGGELEITWSSEASTSLVFTWNRMGDARYETVELDVGDMASANPCEGKTFGSATVNTFFSASSPAAGQVNGVCVRVEDDESTTSYAFGVALPDAHAPDTDGEGDDTDADRNRYVTTRLNWTGIRVVEGFDFELRLVADPGRMNEIQDTTADDDIQAACADGTFLAQRTATRTIQISHAVTSGLTPYTGYLLCARHLNGAGSTSWIVPASEAEHHTLPAAPPMPTPDSSRTGTRDGGEMFDVAWEVDLQNRADVPWPKEGFMVFRTLRLTSSATPKAAACDQAIADADVNETLDGIDFDAEYRRPMAHLASHYAFACIRAEAEDAATRLGPWTIGGRVTIPKKVADLTSEQANAGDPVVLTLDGHTDDSGSAATWYYKANTGPHTTCSSGTTGTESLSVGTNATDLTVGRSYSYTAYGDDMCTQRIDAVSFRVN